MVNGQKKDWWEEQDVQTEMGIEKEASKANNKPMAGGDSTQGERLVEQPIQSNRKPRGYWGEQTVTHELKQIVAEPTHFPTHTEVRMMKRTDLLNQIAKHGGNNNFRRLFGNEPLQKPDGYWTDEIIIMELKKIIAKIDHFPTKKELITTDRGDLLSAIDKHGGRNKFRELLGCGLLKKPDGYWTYEQTLTDLKKIRIETGHFPTTNELSTMKKSGLSRAIKLHGGFNRFRKLLGDEPLRRDNHWTDKTIIRELKKIKEEIGGFPTQAELKARGGGWLLNVIYKHGGSIKFRELLNCKLSQKIKNYWNDQTILAELRKVSDTLDGHIPTHNELISINRCDLSSAILNNGGFNKFIKLMGGELRKNSDGYWTYEQTLSDLRTAKEKLNHFPTQAELTSMGRSDLIHATKLHGGLNRFREVLGGSISVYVQYLAESATYNSRRGKNTEELVNNLLITWCKTNCYPEPTHNKKLAKHNVIEFVCGINKTIGIDVTNTKTVSGDIIRRKYRKKDYHKYLDELWIVVFSNVFQEKDYRKFNNESPDNVRVMSIDVFLKELDISTEEHIISKINDYKNCTFCTKDEFIKRHLNTSLDNYVNNNTGEIK